MIKHYGNYLEGLGVPATMRVMELEVKASRVAMLREALAVEELQLEQMEDNFYKLLRYRYSDEEIEDARLKSFLPDLIEPCTSHKDCLAPKGQEAIPTFNKKSE